MKKNILIVAFALLFIVNAKAQKVSSDNVPVAVKEALKKTYPIVEKLEWELDEENYQADFLLNNREKFVKYDNQGNWIQTESPITMISLPKAVRKSINKKYNGYNINESLKLEKPSGTFYLIELSKSNLLYDVTLTDKGVFTKQEQQGKAKE
ncbi:MAG: PepSY-like domain-containing protein [Bacteroidia bacterium]